MGADLCWPHLLSRCLALGVDPSTAGGGGLCEWRSCGTPGFAAWAGDHVGLPTLTNGCLHLVAIVVMSADARCGVAGAAGGRFGNFLRTCHFGLFRRYVLRQPSPSSCHSWISFVGLTAVVLTANVVEGLVDEDSIMKRSGSGIATYVAAFGRL